LQVPQRAWEMVQMGNCGSPIKTAYGWLLLTHAVGPMRQYVISASLLDLQDPSKVIASLNEALLSPNEDEREGYVPNVLYTCGMMQHDDYIIIPYAMSDSAVGFASVKLSEVLYELMTSKSKP
jgi:beta-1,2-mannobiose phosphorylase / 1,2-beta-oligomannan phosphorylase